MEPGANRPPPMGSLLDAAALELIGRGVRIPPDERIALTARSGVRGAAGFESGARVSPVSAAASKSPSTVSSDSIATGWPHFMQKRAVSAILVPHDGQNMGCLFYPLARDLPINNRLHLHGRTVRQHCCYALQHF